VEVSGVNATYVGQVELDPNGILWAVLYHCERVITREQVRSLRKGKRCVADLVLSAADAFPAGPAPAVRVPVGRHRRANVVAKVA
jgi:hypothetical protein